MRVLGALVISVLTAGAAMVWGVVGLWVVSDVAVEHTEDGPSCIHAVPEIAWPLGLAAVVGLGALVVTGVLATRASLTGRLDKSLAVSSVTLVAAFLAAVLLLSLVPNHTSSGPCEATAASYQL